MAVKPPFDAGGGQNKPLLPYHIATSGCPRTKGIHLNQPEDSPRALNFTAHGNRKSFSHSKTTKSMATTCNPAQLPSARVVVGIDAALVGHDLDSVRTLCVRNNSGTSRVAGIRTPITVPRKRIWELNFCGRVLARVAITSKSILTPKRFGGFRGRCRFPSPWKFKNHKASWLCGRNHPARSGRTKV